MSEDGPRRGLFVAPFDELAEPRLLAELAAAAEARGWDGFFLWDHVQYPAAVEGIADAWVSLAAVATATERLRLGPMVTPLARRRPVVLARQAVTLDRLSGGRLVLGFGVGGDENGEMEELGEEPRARRRAAMLEEGLELLDAIFSGRPVDRRGAHYTVRARPFLPRPVQRPRIPIWLGGRWPGRRPIERAAAWDGVFPIRLGAADVPVLRARVADARPPGLGPCALVAAAPPGEDLGPWREAGVDWLLTDLGPVRRGGDGPYATRSAAAVREAIELGPG